MKLLKLAILLVVAAAVCFAAYKFIFKAAYENRVLKEIIARLEAESRIAEAVVADVIKDPETGREKTTIKFLEYDSGGKPMEPRFFTFPGNVIQFQSLVVRFSDDYVARGDILRGRSIYLFWKVFMLDGANTVEYEITKLGEVPKGYEVGGGPFERKIWRDFWRYALDPAGRKEMGIRSAQIEAPGTMFVPGIIYALKIEHDGGIAIETSPIPAIVK